MMIPTGHPDELELLLDAIRTRGWRYFTREDDHRQNVVLGLKPWDTWPSWATTDAPQEPWGAYPARRASWARARALRLELESLAKLQALRP